jgi:hypothetical protein
MLGSKVLPYLSVFRFLASRRGAKPKNEKQKEEKVPLRIMTPARPRKSCQLYLCFSRMLNYRLQY